MKLVLASFILILSYSASAQRTYIKEWKRIDSLIEKAGLIKTALKETNNIYGSAKKENNDVQVIKGYWYIEVLSLNIDRYQIPEDMVQTLHCSKKKSPQQRNLQDRYSTV